VPGGSPAADFVADGAELQQARRRHRLDSVALPRRPAATLYFDEVRSCTYCDDLNPVFERFLAGDEQDLYHLGAPRPMTLYQIAQVVNRAGGYDPALLMGMPRHQAGPLPPRR